MSDDDRKRLTKLTVKELRKQAVELLGSAAAARLKLKADLVEALTKVAKEALKTVVETLVPVLEKVTSPSTPVAAPTAAPSAASSDVAASTRESRESSQFVARDFFLSPSHKRLPTTYSDDRLLWFRREPSGVVISWDLSPQTFSDGRELSVQLRSSSGAIKSSSAIGASSGLWTLEDISRGESLALVVVQRGSVILSGPAIFLEGSGTATATPLHGTLSHQSGGANQLRTEPWHDAPHPATRPDMPRVHHSSRVSS